MRGRQVEALKLYRGVPKKWPRTALPFPFPFPLTCPSAASCSSSCRLLRNLKIFFTVLLPFPFSPALQVLDDGGAGVKCEIRNDQTHFHDTDRGSLHEGITPRA